LGISWVGHNTIRAYKPPNRGIKIPGPVIVQPVRIQPLPGELLIGGQSTGHGAGSAEVQVDDASGQGPAGTNGSGSATQVIADDLNSAAFFIITVYLNRTFNLF
jgi:hypothetical protein